MVHKRKNKCIRKLKDEIIFQEGIFMSLIGIFRLKKIMNL